jgi:hypothetical protein
MRRKYEKATIGVSKAREVTHGNIGVAGVGLRVMVM